jgi:stage IV sporulation protein FB
MGFLLSFSLLGIPVRVRWSFLLMAAVLGFVGDQAPVFIVAWVAIVFVSILIHELGHALTARSMGAGVEIELNGLGGLTRWSVPPDVFGPGRRALVAGAGSAVGVLFGGLIWLVASQFGPYSGLALFAINNLIFVNLFWGLLNWVPIRPLDGGHLLESLLEKVVPRRADTIARIVFIATAAAALAWALNEQRIFIVILAGWMLLAEFGIGRSKGPAAPLPDFSYDDVEGVGETIDVEGEESDH